MTTTVLCDNMIIHTTTTASENNNFPQTTVGTASTNSTMEHCDDGNAQKAINFPQSLSSPSSPLSVEISPLQTTASAGAIATAKTSTATTRSTCTPPLLGSDPFPPVAESVASASKDAAAASSFSSFSSSSASFSPPSLPAFSSSLVSSSKSSADKARQECCCCHHDTKQDKSMNNGSGSGDTEDDYSSSIFCGVKKEQEGVEAERAAIVDMNYSTRDIFVVDAQAQTCIQSDRCTSQRQGMGCRVCRTSLDRAAARVTTVATAHACPPSTIPSLSQSFSFSFVSSDVTATPAPFSSSSHLATSFSSLLSSRKSPSSTSTTLTTATAVTEQEKQEQLQPKQQQGFPEGDPIGRPPLPSAQNLNLSLQPSSQFEFTPTMFSSDPFSSSSFTSSSSCSPSCSPSSQRSSWLSSSSSSSSLSSSSATAWSSFSSAQSLSASCSSSSTLVDNSFSTLPKSPPRPPPLSVETHPEEGAILSDPTTTISPLSTKTTTTVVDSTLHLTHLHRLSGSNASASLPPPPPPSTTPTLSQEPQGPLRSSDATLTGEQLPIPSIGDNNSNLETKRNPFSSSSTINASDPESTSTLSCQSQLLDYHSHLVYPHTTYSNEELPESTSMSPPSLPHLFVSSTSSSSSSSSWIPCAYNIDEEPQAPISGNGVWENYQERCDATDDIEDDGALEERTGFFSQESDDSDPELKRVQEQHRPLSIKRRKMSVDELESIGGEGHRSSPETERLRQRTQLSFGDGASSPSHLTAERRLSSSRPSSWPARKRRSLLPEPDSDHEDHQHQQQHETSQHRAQHQQHQSASTVDSEQPCSLDTSSLSLLSATSALVSEGADLNIDLDRHEPVTSVPSPPPNPIESTDSQDPTFSVSLLENLSPQHPIQPPPAIKPLKRSFEDAIELTSPLGNDPALDHSGWFESNKRRKVHHFPMRWTSTLSPSPYVKLCSMRDFWDVMKTRVDLSWLDLWTVLNASSRSTVINWRKWRKNSGCTAKSEMAQQQTKTVSNDRHSSSDQEVPISVAETYQRKQQCPQRTIADFRTRKIVMQHPSAGLLLKGLWEEEEKIRRQRQMIPDGVHKPMRSKILNRKPLPRIGALRIPARSMLKESDTLFQRPLSPSSLSSSLSDSSSSSWMSPPTSPELELKDQTLGTSQAEYDELARRKSGTATAVPAHALSEGYDLADYKPWKDGTILPHQGSIPGLNQLRRSTMMEPWPAEESRARDECTRMLHRMREQLNVVINLQIHLRSLVRSSAASGYSTAMKDTTESSTETAMEPMAPPPPMPTSSQMSFLLSIRHPGQVSIELLRALYGPRFLQTSAFRSIEQLLWGPHLHVHRERPYYHEEHQQHQVQRSSHMMDQDAQYSSPSSENTRGYRRQSTEYDYHQSDGEYHNYDIGAGQDVNNKYAYDHDLHHEQEHVVEEHSDSDESQQEHLDPHHYSHKRRQQHEFVQEDLSDNSSRFFSKGFSESSVTVIPGDKACEDTIRDLEVGYSAQF